MPTGYTEKILDGNSSFEDFALNTASAFSYLAQSVNEGKDPKNSPLPKPESYAKYHQEQVNKLTKQIKNVTKMSFNRAAKMAKRDFDKDSAYYNERITKAVVNATRLKAMQVQVEAYQPPDSEKARGHKKYMLEQLKMTLESDGDPRTVIKYSTAPKLLTASEWKAAQIKELKRQLQSSKEGATEDIERGKREVAFLSELRTAVKEQAPKLAKLKP